VVANSATEFSKVLWTVFSEPRSESGADLDRVSAIFLRQNRIYQKANRQFRTAGITRDTAAKAINVFFISFGSVPPVARI
jgi:hypothetical protein